MKQTKVKTTVSLSLAALRDFTYTENMCGKEALAV